MIFISVFGSGVDNGTSVGGAISLISLAGRFVNGRAHWSSPSNVSGGRRFTTTKPNQTKNNAILMKTQN